LVIRHSIEKWHSMTERHNAERRKLIEYCKAHLLTQKEAADILGISESYLSKYLRTHGIPWWKQRKKRRTVRKMGDW